MIDDQSREDLLAAVDHAVDELLAAAGVTAPPVDVLAIAAGHLAWTIRHDDTARRRSPKRDVGYEVVIRPGLSTEQAHFAVARAIGAARKPDILRRLGIPPEEQKGLLSVSPGELFAEHLLLPTPWFGLAARRLDFDVLELQSLFKTAGHQLVAERLLDLSEPCVITIVDNGTVVRRRSNAWRVRRQLSPAEEACRHDIERRGQSRQVRHDGWTARGWPVPRSDGTRVILRAVVDEPT
jgi:predicted transcriptional regulator